MEPSETTPTSNDIQLVMRMGKPMFRVLIDKRAVFLSKSRVEAIEMLKKIRAGQTI